jgi:hypothetical protein
MTLGTSPLGTTAAQLGGVLLAAFTPPTISVVVQITRNVSTKDSLI